MQRASGKMGSHHLHQRACWAVGICFHTAGLTAQLNAAFQSFQSDSETPALKTLSANLAKEAKRQQLDARVSALDAKAQVDLLLQIQTAYRAMIQAKNAKSDIGKTSAFTALLDEARRNNLVDWVSPEISRKAKETVACIKVKKGLFAEALADSSLVVDAELLEVVFASLFDQFKTYDFDSVKSKCIEVLNVAYDMVERNESAKSETPGLHMALLNLRTLVTGLPASDQPQALAWINEHKRDPIVRTFMYDLSPHRVGSTCYEALKPKVDQLVLAADSEAQMAMRTQWADEFAKDEQKIRLSDGCDGLSEIVAFFVKHDVDHILTKLAVDAEGKDMMGDVAIGTRIAKKPARRSRTEWHCVLCGSQSMCAPWWRRIGGKSPISRCPVPSMISMCVRHCS